MPSEANNELVEEATSLNHTLSALLVEYIEEEGRGRDIACFLLVSLTRNKDYTLFCRAQMRKCVLFVLHKG